VRGRRVHGQPQHDQQAMQRDTFQGKGQIQHAVFGAWRHAVR
jgi:hypothetical protein